METIRKHSSNIILDRYKLSEKYEILLNNI